MQLKSNNLSNNQKLIELKSIKQKSGKMVHAWAFENQEPINTKTLKSNTVEIEYPPKSEKKITFPEMDKYDFFNYEEAMKKINIAQQPFLKETREYLILKKIIDAKNL